MRAQSTFFRWATKTSRLAKRFVSRFDAGVGSGIGRCSQTVAAVYGSETSGSGFPARVSLRVEFFSTGGAPSLPLALERGAALRAWVFTAALSLGLVAFRPEEAVAAATS